MKVENYQLRDSVFTHRGPCPGSSATAMRNGAPETAPTTAQPGLAGPATIALLQHPLPRPSGQAGSRAAPAVVPLTRHRSNRRFALTGACTWRDQTAGSRRPRTDRVTALTMVEDEAQLRATGLACMPDDAVAGRKHIPRGQPRRDLTYQHPSTALVPSM